MRQPRKGYEDKDFGVLNVSAADITIDASHEVKSRFLVACNACSFMGRKYNSEFATLLYVCSGRAVDGCELKKGTENSVSLVEWVPLLEQSEEFSLSIVHNHPNGLPFSLEDIEEFLLHKSLKSMWLSSGKRLYYLEKTERFRTTYEDLVNKIRIAAKNIQKIYANDKAEIAYLVFKEAFAYSTIRFERW